MHCINTEDPNQPEQSGNSQGLMPYIFFEGQVMLKLKWHRHVLKGIGFPWSYTDVIKLLSCLTQLSMKFVLHITVKLPTTIAILAYPSWQRADFFYIFLYLRVFKISCSADEILPWSHRSVCALEVRGPLYLGHNI